jgi:hypothetical protein
MPERETLHPALAAALERDGISVAELARLVEMSPKTVNRWSDAIRDLCDFIAGRARAVRVEGGPIGGPALQSWMLERLGDDGVPRADVARAIVEIEAMAAKALAAADTLRGLTGTVQKSESRVLTHRNQGYTVETMNPTLLHSVASQVRERAKGRMVMFAQKVPPDFSSRLAASAARAGMSPSDYLRALVELHTEPVEPVS